MRFGFVFQRLIKAAPGKNPIGKDSFLRHWEQRALFLQRPEHLEVCRLPPISALCGEAVLPPFIGADDIDLSVSRPPASEMQECFRDFSFEAPSEQILPACRRKRFMSEFSKIRLDLLFPVELCIFLLPNEIRLIGEEPEPEFVQGIFDPVEALRNVSGFFRFRKDREFLFYQIHLPEHNQMLRERSVVHMTLLSNFASG